jgi:adhesin transport system membrane fusion protein
MNKINFSDLDLRKLDLTRKYDDDLDGDAGISWQDHILLYAIVALVAFFIIWASFTHLDEVARGDGKVIPSSEVQVIQNLEGGIIDEFLVKEGDHVKDGQVLLRMHDIQAKADYGSTNQKYLGIFAATIRLEAEAEGKEPAFPEDIVKGAPESVSAERAAYAANKKQYENQVSVLKDQLAQKEQEVAELTRHISDIGNVMKLAQDERDMVAPMVKRGAAAKKELLQIDRQLAQQRTELNGLRLSLPRAEGAVKEMRGRIEEQESGFRAGAQKDLSEKTAELATIRQTLGAFQDRSARTEIKSPMNGTVKDIKIKTVGGVARAGEPIMEIVPAEDQLIVEARVKPSDIAFIHPGQKAVVRLTACDFSVYGAFNGIVDDISADSLSNEKGESFYRVKVRTEQTKLVRGDKECIIIPGMQATVDIVTGKKTIMTYLLKPFIKASQTALRER